MKKEQLWIAALIAEGVLAAGALGYFLWRKFAGKRNQDPNFDPDAELISEPIVSDFTLITNKLLTPGASHGRTGQKLDAKGVVVHYVANPGSTALANRNYFENGAAGNHTSCHYIVGLQGEVLRLIPEDERAMHAGKAYGAAWADQAKTNNSTYLGIEVCHPDKTGKFSDVTYESLIELTADICSRHGFDPYSDVKRHYDVTGKLCPLYYVNNPPAWEKMKNDINGLMEGEGEDDVMPTEPSDWAQEAWDWAIANRVTDGSDPRGNATREQCVSMIFRASTVENS
jgi:N-acetylmuramoyl-L-alanine amidase